MIDHLRNTSCFGLDDLQMLILDEADRLLELGFKEEVPLRPQQSFPPHCLLNPLLSSVSGPVLGSATQPKHS